MKTALFIITSDPRREGRAAEGIRIAAGVAAWQKVAVRVYLDTAAARALAGTADALEDVTLIRQCLPMVGTRATPVLVPEGDLTGLDSTVWETEFSGVDPKNLAGLAAGSDWVMRF